jgi:DNA-binding transcriptional ArsR family regulator
MTPLRLSAADLSRLRFAQSPLVEVVESLWMLAAGRIRAPFREWHRQVRGRLSSVDTALLGAVVPGQPVIADFLIDEPATDIDRQLAGIAGCPPEVVRADLDEVWAGLTPPPVLRDITASPAGPHRLADALHAYWSAAIEPEWPRIRAALDDDIAHRAHRLTEGGTAAVFDDLHPDLAGKDLTLPESAEAGLRLVPSVFTWPFLLVARGRSGPPSLIYGARQAETLWRSPVNREPDDDAVGALLGRTRAAILARLGLPATTTELAGALDQSPAAVSHHLSVLRQNGLVTSWRSGRRVLYQRTPLGNGVLVAGGGPTSPPVTPGETERPR